MMWGINNRQNNDERADISGPGKHNDIVHTESYTQQRHTVALTSGESKDNDGNFNDTAAIITGIIITTIYCDTNYM